MSKRLKMVFMVSLIINVLLVGIVGGLAYKKWSAHPWHKIKHELSPETRHIVGRSLQGAFRDIKPLGNKARKARADLVKILSADEFDGEKYDQAAQRLVTVQDQMRAKKIEVTKEVASQLSVEEREKMADRMTRMIGGGREHKVKRHRKPHGVKPERKPSAGE
jgi:uncharacterized membrane protein